VRISNRRVALEKTSKPSANNQSEPKTVSRKLSYKEKRELEDLPDRIARLETEQALLEARTADPSFFAGDSNEVAEVLDRLSKASNLLDDALERLIELEG
jgi:ATP-binding cassette subfamily F protein uup